MTVSARWTPPLCGLGPDASRVALGRPRRASKPHPNRVHKKTAQMGGSFIDGGGPGIDVTAVASRAHTLAGALCCACRRQNFAFGKVFRAHGVLTQSQITDTKKSTPRGAFICMAVGQGFEPREPLGSTVFKTAAFDHSASPPKPVSTAVEGSAAL